MKRILLYMVAVVWILTFLWQTVAHAFYTECTVTKEMHLANRPNGSSDPRFGIIKKGDKVAFRDKYKDWWFVLHYNYDGKILVDVNYGWIPRSVLTDCQQQEGTP
jgi:hypothetical protein